MKRIIKKINSTVLATALLISTFPSSGLAAELKIPEWTLAKGSGSDIQLDEDISYDGTSLKFTSASNASAVTYVEVESGKEYKLKFYAKGKDVNSATVSIGGKSYSLKPVSSTYDWTFFSFTYKATADNKNLAISFSVSGNVKGFWIDGVTFTDNANPTVNLIKNSEMSLDAISSDLAETEAGSLEEEFRLLKAADRFTVEKLDRVMGALDTIPIKRAANITIDGDGSDWENYSSITIPTLTSQYALTNKDMPMDLNASLKMAYDDERFYFLCEVEDDIHTYDNSATYWQQDSIQFTLSKTSDGYGYEIGLMYDDDNDVSNIYSTALTDTELKAMKYKASRSDGKTTYEISVPWTIYYGAVCPDDMLLGFLINENDGKGRANCLQLSDGIAETKDNSNFPMLKFIGEENSRYGWIDGERKPTINEDNLYNLYLVNYGEDKDFVLEYPNGETETVTIPQNEGVRKSIVMNYTDSGDDVIQVKVDGGETIDFAVNVLPDKAKVDTYCTLFEKKLKEIDKLMTKCDKAGISYDDEQAYYTIIERFIKYLNDDADSGDFTRVDYTIEKVSELCEESIANLNAYLNGEKVSVPTPNYVVTGEDTIDGQDIIALTETNGEEEKRPMFFIGFGHFETAVSDSYLFPSLGYNNAQMEMGPDVVLRSRGNVPNWHFEINGGAKASVEVTTKEKASGEKALSITNTSAVQDNVYASVTKSFVAKPNTSYKLGFKMKAKQAVGFWYTLNNFDTRNFITETPADWTEYETTYTTGNDQNFIILRFAIAGPTEECFIDDVYVYEEGSTENMLNNGGFENEDDGIYWETYYHYMQTKLSALDTYEKNGQAVGFLISPHYLTAGLLNLYEEMKPGTQIMNPGYNINSDIARKYIEDYLRAIMPLLKDKKAIQSIVLANEPHLGAAGLPSFYQPRWQEFLINKYGTIERLNEAWNENYDDFSKVLMPTTQSYNTQFYDYVEFCNRQFQDWYLFMKDIIREYTDIPVNVKIMTTLGEHDHQGVDRRYKMAFGESPEPYSEFCEINGNDAILYPDWVSAGEEGELEKSFYYDYQTSLRNAPVYNSEDHIINDMDSNYTDFYADFVETDLWQGALHGRTISSVWTWSRATSADSIFNGLFLYRPDCLAEISKVNNDLNRYVYEVKSIRDEKRDVALFYSISSRIYQTEYMNSVYKAYESLSYNGKHSLIVNEENIADKLSDCDALIIPHATHCKAEALSAIKTFIENGGKVMILGEDSLEFTEETLAKNDEAVREYILNNSTVIPCKADGNYLAEPSDKDLCDYVETFLKDGNLRYIRVIDEDTGDTSDNIEWMYGVKDGKIYVNVNNYNIGETKRIKIEIGGTVQESGKDLRNQTEVGEVIEIEPYSPTLLEYSANNLFLDTIGHWSEDDVVTLSNKGIVSGMSVSRFAPNKQISRAEFLTLVLKVLDKGTEKYANEFDDVNENDWYSGIIAAAKKCGFTDEMADGRNINPTKAITREEIMTVLAKAYEYSGRTLTESEDVSFGDTDDIGEKFAPYVKKAIGMGWVKGVDGKLLPNDTSTRAEAAALINRFSEGM